MDGTAAREGNGNRSVAFLSSLLVVLVSCASSSLLAQDGSAPGAHRPSGFRVEGHVSLARPYLGGDGADFIDSFGTFGAGAGGTFGLGVDWRHIGISGTVDINHPDLNGSPATALALALTLQWSPAIESLGSWQPLLSAGYVRQGVVANDVSVVGQPAPAADLGIKGNGVRLGLAVEHPLARRLTVTVGATGDIMSFGTASLNGAEGDVAHPGVSVVPRLALGVRYWPFSQ